MDQTILSDARIGDEAAWRKLYDDIAPDIRGYFRARRVPDPEDLVGTVFLEIARGIERFEGDHREFRAWAFTIAHHKWVDQVRASRRRPASPWDAAFDEASTADVEGEAIAAVQRDDLLRLVDSLPSAQRSVVLLRVMGDLTHEEIAVALGKSVMAVRVNYHRGIKSLRASVGSSLGDDDGIRELAPGRSDVTL